MWGFYLNGKYCSISCKVKSISSEIGGGEGRRTECGPSICRLKLAFSKILKYEKLSLPIRLMMDPWDRTTLFNCLPGCLIGISNLIYLNPISHSASASLSSLLGLFTQKMEPTTLLFMPTHRNPLELSLCITSHIQLIWSYLHNTFQITLSATLTLHPPLLSRPPLQPLSLSRDFHP